MFRAALPRLKAAVLAAVVLSGGGGLPVLDLFMMHHGRTEVARPHFEAADTPHSHGDVCTLGSELPYAPQAVPLDVSLPIGTVCGPPDVALAASAPRSSKRSLLPQPRAPPSLPA